MMDNLNYQIFPSEIEPKTVTYTVADWRKRDNFWANLYVGGGCLLMIGLYAVCIVTLTLIFNARGEDRGIGWVFLAMLGPIGFVLLIGRLLDKVRISAIENRISTELNNKETIRANEEAKSLTSKVTHAYESSIKLAAELSEDIKEASLWLEDAEGEYKENAFSSFWDSIEDAARHLADYNNKLSRISTNAQVYYEKLKGRKHNFPTFPITNSTIPDASSVISEFHRVVRLGQTNFQFANIWEHRRTRKAMIAGFHSLAEAVNGISYKIEESISDLQGSISSDVAIAVEEEIKTREAITDTGRNIDKRFSEQNRLLDNQHHHGDI
jgi:hypothetical protein